MKVTWCLGSPWAGIPSDSYKRWIDVPIAERKHGRKRLDQAQFLNFVSYDLNTVERPYFRARKNARAIAQEPDANHERHRNEHYDEDRHRPRS